jgi:hypothetical protein
MQQAIETRKDYSRAVRIHSLDTRATHTQTMHTHTHTHTHTQYAQTNYMRPPIRPDWPSKTMTWLPRKLRTPYIRDGPAAAPRRGQPGTEHCYRGADPR